ncbi:ATP-binding cassette domain-containing protein [Floricoccus penangensis]|uniref:ATP-binding cassette domain-containing protein n=1 Tax=Floricoccus penangensis TaxID=1859475 RepID=UPI00203BA712|nr:ABC transporter ATP-binding protein [Floricoccus penangensis]URZ88091.1 ABC transporter ATP-binding protein [Floricoccus penangensis]
MSKVIKTVNLDKTYKEVKAIDSVNLDINSGDICALIGKNGAGKSTLFKMLSGQVLPTNGEIELFGFSKNALSKGRQRIGFMVEESAFIDNFTAKQNLEYFRIQRGVVEKKRIDEVLHIVDLENTGKKKFKQFSMGMKQRLGLALALLASPDCLVLDEPTNGLDAEGINEIRRLMLRLNEEEGLTILISSHILSELQLVSNRFIFINKGKIVEDISKKVLDEKCRKQIKIQVNNPSKALQSLEESFPDIILTVLDGDWIRVENHLEESASLNQLLMKNGVEVKEIAVENVSLEDYFLKLVEG